MTKFFVTANVRDLVKKGKLTQDKAEKTLSMLKGVLDYSDFKEVDMVIEVGSKTHSDSEIWNFKPTKSL